ncbi:MAG: AgmX/PglI C-terminal domain-containing protein [Bdellovibrionales bacterium]
MKEQFLYIEHFNNDKFCTARKVNPRHRHFVLGSSRVADLRLLGDQVGGVQAVLEYRSPNWYLVGCGTENDVLVNNTPVSEFKVLGGEYVQIGSHGIRLHLADPARQLYGVEQKTNQDWNSHQVLVVKNGDIIDTKFLEKSETFEFHFDGKAHNINPPKSSDWKFHTFGDFLVQSRLTFKPEEVLRQKPSLKLITGDAKNLAGVSLAIALIVASFSLIKPAEVKNQNRFVQMIYDAQLNEQLKKEAEELVKERFVASETAPTEIEQSYQNADIKEARKIVKRIKAKGISKMIGRLTKRSLANLKFNSVNQVRKGSKTSNSKINVSKIARKKLDLADSNRKGKLSKNFKRKLSSLKSGLAKGTVAATNMEIQEKEILLDGGLDREVIAAVIRKNIGEIRYCYERQLSADKDLQGKVKVEFTIDAKGSVARQTVKDTTLKSAKVEGCILRRIAGWKFPKPKGGTKVLVAYPFLFKSIN